MRFKVETATLNYKVMCQKFIRHYGYTLNVVQSNTGLNRCGNGCRMGWVNHFGIILRKQPRPGDHPRSPAFKSGIGIPDVFGTATTTMGKKCGINLGLMKPTIVMVLVQVMFAGINICYALAAANGMDLRVMVAYHFLLWCCVPRPHRFLLRKVMACFKSSNMCVHLWKVETGFVAESDDAFWRSMVSKSQKESVKVGSCRSPNEVSVDSEEPDSQVPNSIQSTP